MLLPPPLPAGLQCTGKCFSRGHVWEPEDASPSSCWAVPLASSLPGTSCTSVDGGGQLWWGRGAGHRVRITSVSTSGGLRSPPDVFGLGSGPKQEILSLCGQHRKGWRWSARVTVCRPSAFLLSCSFPYPPGPQDRSPLKPSRSSTPVSTEVGRGRSRVRVSLVES